jgi:FtsZ-binding cell division protein ZapB
MTQSFWESEGVEAAEAPAVEVLVEQELVEEPIEPQTIAVSADDFSALEERVLRAVELVKRERLARGAAEERAARIEEQLNEQAPLVESLQKEVNALRTERDYVRQRVERLLGQLDGLEL